MSSCYEIKLVLSHQSDIADLIGHSIAILRKDYYASCRKGLSME